jgi:ABC-type antimicrobial peptide transport system permease subunit
MSASLAGKLKENAPEIKEVTRVAEEEFTFVNGDMEFREKGIYADDNFFKLFTFPFSEGKMNMSEDPNSVVISERMALKFFGNKECTGKTLIIKKEEGGTKSLRISGTFNDVPASSSLQFDFAIPFSQFLSDNGWALEDGATSNQTWALLEENADYRHVEDKIRSIIKNDETTLNQELFLFPLKDKVLYSYAGGRRVWKEIQNVIIAGSIGLVILLIACFNFINLAIAMNFGRYKETGIKKTAGASKSSIIIQFLGETMVITFASLIVAIILSKIVLTGINMLFKTDIASAFLNVKMILAFLAILLFTCLISGFIPAWYLASSNPMDSLRGRRIKGPSFSIFRQSLIVFQFIIPVVLIISMMIIKTQDKYMRSFDVGVEQDKVIILENTAGITAHKESIKAELMSLPGITAVTYTNCIPSRGAKVSNEVSWEGKDPTEKLHFWCINTDYDYNKAVNIKMVDGRFFDKEFTTDSSSYIINDIAAGIIKSKEPVGTAITVNGKKGTIIGTFRDFHAIDLAGPLVPVIISISKEDQPDILIRFSTGSFPEIAGMIKNVYLKYEKEVPFRATLFRDLIPYTDLTLPSGIAGMAFFIAILLACLGLSGLASFTAESRTKEIGVRKVNGATNFSMMRLLLTGYAKWLIISFIFAMPIAFIVGKVFLGKFYFHTPMPLWAFLAGPAIAFAAALITVLSRTWKIADRNPVISLRYE